jgi:hypothetical protein
MPAITLPQLRALNGRVRRKNAAEALAVPGAAAPRPPPSPPICAAVLTRRTPGFQRFILVSALEVKCVLESDRQRLWRRGG